MRRPRSKNVFGDSTATQHPRAGPPQRRLRRHRLAGAQRLRRRARRDARARSCGSRRSSTTRPPPRRARCHPALARDRRLPRDGGGPPGPPAPVLPRGARRASRTRSAAAGYDLLLFASERPGNGFGTPLLPQALPPPQRRGRGAHGPRRRRPRGAPARALRGRHGRRRRRARGPAHELRHVRQRGRRGARGRATCTGSGTAGSRTITGLLDTRPGADRLRGYRHALQALGLAVPRRVRRLRRLLRRERPPGRDARCSRCRSRRRRSSPPRT